MCYEPINKDGGKYYFYIREDVTIKAGERKRINMGRADDAMHESQETQRQRKLQRGQPSGGVFQSKKRRQTYVKTQHDDDGRHSPSL